MRVYTQGIRLRNFGKISSKILIVYREDLQINRILYPIGCDSPTEQCQIP